MAGYAFSKKPIPTEPVHSSYRNIQTLLPVPESIPLLDDLDRYESRSMHGQMPVIWDRAKDFQVFDRWGNIWIDFTSTIFVANSGHANDEILNALRGVLDQELLHTYTYASEMRARFLKKLIEFSPPSLEKAYLVSAGTEASEMVIKLMRLNAASSGKRRPGIIVFDGSFHGRTMGAAQISGNSDQRQWIGHNDPNIFRLPFPYDWDENDNPVSVSGADRFANDCERLRASGIDLARDVCGIVFESYIGWSAAFFPEDYVKAWAKQAKEDDFLVAFDEIQSGFGRTGKLFAYEHYGVEADLISCGKGLSSSLPLAAVIGRGAVMDLPDIGSMSSTHSANPMSCAAGLANLEAIEKHNLVSESERKGKLLADFLHHLQVKHPERISHVTCKGMVAAIMFREPDTGKPDGMTASRICDTAMRKGLLLVHTGRESIKFGPPLTIPDDALQEGLNVFEEAMLQVFNDGEK